MKQAMSFRFGNRTIARLTTLSKQLHLSRTDILERAVDYYAKKQLRAQSDLMKFVGVLSDEDADAMQKAIRESRCNKNKDTEF